MPRFTVVVRDVGSGHERLRGTGHGGDLADILTLNPGRVRQPVPNPSQQAPPYFECSLMQDYLLLLLVVSMHHQRAGADLRLALVTVVGG
jgi:hypothetical protein